MRVLVNPPGMRIGGSQLGAVELAELLALRGHDVLVASTPGPLCARLARAGIPFEPLPAEPKIRPWPRTAARLAAIARRHRADVVHAFEWPPILEASLGPRLLLGTPVVGTVMSMGVAPFIPSDLDLVVGTEQIARSEQGRRPRVRCVEPPVDTDANRPGAGTGDDTLPDLRADDFVVTVVSRLAAELKRDGLLEAVVAAGLVAADLPLRLVIVGDGPVRQEIHAAATAVNTAAGREVVTLTGELLDPRAAYDRADVVLGMGSSALRGMAFAKPLVVQGERGFWELLDPTSVDGFLDRGWYGVGDGDSGADRLADLLRRLHQDPELRTDLGAYSLRLVTDRFSLRRATDLHETFYREALARRSGTRLAAVAGLTGVAGAYRHELGRWAAARRGSIPLEDFNSIAAQAKPSRV